MTKKLRKIQSWINLSNFNKSVYSKKYLKKAIIINLLALFIVNNDAFADNPQNHLWASRSVPIYDFFIVTQTPADWQFAPAYEKGDGKNYYMIEFLPKGQTVKEWENMITIYGYRNLNITPKEYFLSAHSVAQNTLCGENSRAQTIKETDNMLIGAIFCGEPKNDKELGGLKKGHGEITLYRIYKAGDSLYSIFHSWRGKAFDAKDKNNKDFPATIDDMQKYIEASNDTLICDRKNPPDSCKNYIELHQKISWD